MTWRFGLGSLLAFLLFLISGCGGGSSSSPSAPEAVCTGGSPPGLASGTSTTQPVYESTCAGTVNTPVVTLTICVPHTTPCKDVPNILLDYGSTGLRLSHTLSIAAELPQEKTTKGRLYECYSFESGYNYGPVVTATVTLGTNPVTVPVQISNSSLSAPCGGTSSPFEPYYNGILGVLFPQYDTTDSSAAYYAGGQHTTPPQAEIVRNPVYRLPSSSNKNGVRLSISTVVYESSGASGFTGTLSFGALSGATFLQTDTVGEITATYGGASYPAFFDTGSNGFFFDTPSITQCTGNFAGFFCQNAPHQSARMTPGTGTGTGQYTLKFSIDDAQSLLSTGNTVFSTLGGFQAGLFDAGFPAFLYGQAIGLSWNSNCAPNPNSGQGCFVIE